FSSQSAGRILKVGLLFFVLQVAATVGYRSDNIIIARMLGAEMVTHYAIPIRLFSIVSTILGFVLTPLWPAYGESIARGDVEWIKNMLKKSLLLSMAVSVPIVLVLVTFGVQILYLWVGPEVIPSTRLLLGFGLWTLLSSLGGPLAMFLNGLEAMKFQAACATFMAIANIILSITLVRSIGLPGIIVSTIIAQIVFILIPSAVYIPRLLASVQSQRIE
ncbi:MAG: MATE family efflux transporter, partial [Anaerolineae bacterium]|nr:MATE family efflux transporter [Anaerolineae bacterium]